MNDWTIAGFIMGIVVGMWLMYFELQREVKHGNHYRPERRRDLDRG